MSEPSLTFRGLRVIASMYIGDIDQVKRTFKERFFSLPWRPLVKYKTIYNPKVFKFSDDTYLCSYETYWKISRGEFK